jgi:Domain of unknown function (DUF929)
LGRPRGDDRRRFGIERGMMPTGFNPHGGPTRRRGVAIGSLLVVGLLAPFAAPAGAAAPAPRTASTYVYIQASSTIVSELSSVPVSVSNTIGVSSPTVTVSPPIVVAGQHPYDGVIKGRSVPGFFDWGADFCPFCAATSWGVIVALARFGTFTRLYDVNSSPTDVDPNTPSFTFYGSMYTSSLLLFNGIETQDPSGVALMQTPHVLQQLVNRYDTGDTFPFIDIQNRFFLSQSAFDPMSLQGLTRYAIAKDLSDPTNPVTMAIVTEANYFSAAVCAVDHERPGAVCTSPGVEKADVRLKLAT